MDMDAAELQEILNEFHTEASEGMDKLEQDLMLLEEAVDSGELDADVVDRVFRTLHTIKGGAGFLGLEKLSKLAHAGENLLDEVRGKRVVVTTNVMNALLQTNDNLRALLQCSMDGSNPSEINTEALVATLEKLSLGDDVAVAETASAAVAINEDLLNEVLSDASLNPELAKPEAGDIATEQSSDVAINEDLLNEVLGDPSLNPELAKPEEGDIAPAQVAAIPEEIIIKRGAPAPERRTSKEDRRGDENRTGGRREADKPEVTIRVETRRLDKVMNQVGELVLARNSLLRQLRTPEAQVMLGKLNNATLVQQNLEIFSRVTQDLQLSVLGTRMQAVKKVFDKIPRMVRELKTKLGKEVELEISGEYTEVDKTLVEELADPMVHLIRNALDHGLETPDERLAAGKPIEGKLWVKAYYEGNSVVIEVGEDGKGINPDVIKNIALKKGIITEQQANSMPDSEAQKLIMAAGFSTAEKISDVSGRGVGMDVVNAKIKSLKGTLDIISSVGKGTTMKISLPLTLAIMQALLVETQEEGFAIPIGDITEVIQFKTEQIHQVNNQDVIELRGSTLPLYYLSSVTESGLATRPTTKGYVIVVKEGSNSLGLVVDKLIGQEEAVVKKVTNLFDYNPAVAGATITGDGTVHMILDIPFLLKELSRAA